MFSNHFSNAATIPQKPGSPFAFCSDTRTLAINDTTDTFYTTAGASLTQADFDPSPGQTMYWGNESGPALSSDYFRFENDGVLSILKSFGAFYTVQSHITAKSPVEDLHMVLRFSDTNVADLIDYAGFTRAGPYGTPGTAYRYAATITGFALFAQGSQFISTFTNAGPTVLATPAPADHYAVGGQIITRLIPMINM